MSNYKSLEARYNGATADSYVGRVRIRQASLTATGPNENGVDYMDGQPKGTGTDPDKYQTEFKRNNAGTFKYDNVGNRGKKPGTDGSTDGLSGLTRWKGDALQIAFTNSGAGLTSQWTRRKGFKSAQTVKWTDPTDNTAYGNYHRWIPTTSFVDSLPSEANPGTQSRVKTTPKGPSPAGFP